MVSIIDKAIGLLAPHQCLLCAAEGSIVCNRCSSVGGEPVQPRCAGCKALSIDYKTCTTCRSWLDVYAVRAAVPYDGIYEKIVRAYKFDVQRTGAQPMARLMHEAASTLPDDAMLCPLPTAPNRIRLRGFDHAWLLAQEYGRLVGVKPSRLLERHTNNRQLGSSRDQRMKQMSAEFYVPNNVDVKGKEIVLLDDVMTTGASLAGAARSLKHAGATRVYAVVFAQAG